jgi:hypothetical protein
VFSQLELGPQLLAGLKLAGLNLLPQVFGDLPVHRVGHRPSSPVKRVPIGLIPPVQTTWAISLSGIFGLGGFIPNFDVVTPYQMF